MFSSYITDPGVLTFPDNNVGFLLWRVSVKQLRDVLIILLIKQDMKKIPKAVISTPSSRKLTLRNTCYLLLLTRVLVPK